MKRHWITVFVVLLGGLALTAFFFAKPAQTHDTPVRIPNRSEVVPPGSGTQDIIKTADESRIPELVRPSLLIKQSTKRLLDISCSEGTDYCKLQAIYNFVRLNFEYTARSIESPYIRPPSELLLYGRGDGIEIALLMASMQRAAGFRNEIVRSPQNVWVRTYLGNNTIMIDPSCSGCSVMESHVKLRGDEMIYD